MLVLLVFLCLENLFGINRTQQHNSLFAIVMMVYEPVKEGACSATENIELCHGPRSIEKVVSINACDGFMQKDSY